MKIVKMLSIAALVSVLAGVLTGCVVETHRWRPHYYHPVVLVR